MPGFYARLEGRQGRIEVPALAIRIGELTSWVATRRAQSGVESDFYDLRGVCGWVTEALFKDDDYRKSVFVRIVHGGTENRVVVSDGKQTLQGRSLVMERVQFEKV